MKYVYFLFALVISNSLFSQSETRVPIFNSNDSVYFFNTTWRNFVKNKFYVDPNGLTGDGFQFQLNSANNGFSLIRNWRMNGTKVYYDGGLVGIGTNDPFRPLELVRSFDAFIRVRGDNNTGIELIGSRNGPVFWGTSVCRGTTTSPAIVQNNDGLGEFRFSGWDGAQYRLGGGMGFYVDGTPQSFTMPTAFYVDTNRDGFGAPNRRLTIDNFGRFAFGPNAPTFWMDVQGNVNRGQAIMNLQTPNDTSRIFLHNTTDPSNISAVTAKVGDLLVSTATNNASLWLKRTGYNNTAGWGKFFNLSDANGATNGQALTWNGTSYVPTTVPSGSGLTSQIAFFSNNNILSGNNNLLWDNANNRMVINGAYSGNSALTVRSNSSNETPLVVVANSASIQPTATFTGNSSANDDNIRFNNSAGTKVGSVSNSGEYYGSGMISQRTDGSVYIQPLNSATTGGTNRAISLTNNNTFGASTQTEFAWINAQSTFSASAGGNTQSIFRIAPSIFPSGTNTTAFNGIHINMSASPNPTSMEAIRISNTFGNGILQTSTALTNRFAGSTIFGSVATPTSRLHVVGEGSTNATITSQFHNSTGTSNSLVIRDDGNIAIGRSTITTGNRLDVAGNVRITQSAGFGFRVLSTGNRSVFIGTDEGGTISSGANGIVFGGTNNQETPLGTNPHILAIGANELQMGNLNTLSLRGSGTATPTILGMLSGNQSGTSLRFATSAFNSGGGNQGDVTVIAVGHNNGNAPFNPNTGSTTYTDIAAIGTINQTGTANGITRGFLANPTLTSVVQYRGLDLPFSNANAYGVYQGGALTRNFFNGNTGFGVIAPTAMVHLAPGTTTVAPFSFTLPGSSLLDTPLPGRVETNGTDRVTFTNSSSVRRSFAYTDELPNLDQAYNNFGANAAIVRVDSVQGQTGGLEFESTGNNPITFDLQGTGDFRVQDNATNVFRVANTGFSSVGPVAPNASQRFLASENGSSVTVPLRVTNNNEPSDGLGVQLPLRIGAEDQFAITAYDPVGSYSREVAMSVNVSSALNPFMVMNADLQETRINNAVAYEIDFQSATTVNFSGQTSALEIPSTATTTVVNLPEIVAVPNNPNQVRVGYVLYISIDRSASVTINRTGTSDTFYQHGETAPTTSLVTSPNTFWNKRLVAVGLDKWVVF